ncbi:unnamed protein product [Ambrosiozyma monospora]|uniref:Alpha-1,3-glucosyltransferase n=1 Tax=Ambrosiozyma monospora TaxID=43982 RepID=A0A9W6Z7B6_AMBMO|nr:unnamed protein product [Ambrosiozyma monospora]
MRITAIASELVVYIPAIMMYTKWMGRYYNNALSIDQTIIAAAILFQPSLIIIDHGHFQYNSVMLGFTLMSVVYLLHDYYAMASIFFVLSIGFKQMALYYSPVIFFYLLSVSVWPLSTNFNILRLITIGVATISTFIFLFAPFIYAGGIEQIYQILFRVFPFGRGLFEDKVANFWCATNIVIKYRELFTTDQLKKLSLLLTLIGMAPSCIAIFFKPKKNLLAWCLIATSMSFYLFSFQVHEKSILLPLMPITLLLNEVNADVISMVCWISNMALFSMWPLIKRDGLWLQYAVLAVMSNWLMGNLSWIRKFVSLVGIKIVSPRDFATTVLPHNIFWTSVIITTYIAAGALHYIDLFIAPPANLPDLWVIGNVVLSFGCFLLFFLWVNYKIFAMTTTTTPKVKKN